MFLKSIHVNNDIEFDSNRKDHAKRFDIKTERHQVIDYRRPIIDPNKSHGRPQYKKRTITNKSFIIFKKGLELNFEKNITIIVGDNGCGKTSLFSYLKPPDLSLLPFHTLHGKTEDEAKKEIFEEYLNNDKVKLTFKGSPDFIILEKDIHKNSFTERLKGSATTLKPNQVSMLFGMYESSNGENTLDFLKTLGYVKNALIVLDEPETSLSLKSQKLIKDHLKKVSKNNQIIIITHSPILMKLSDEVYDFEAKHFISTDKYIESQL